MIGAERWTRVKQIFNAALDLPPDERARLVDDACGDDAELRREVLSLLASDSSDDDFLENPAVTSLGYLSAQLLKPGSLLGPYRIVRQLGSGGMGVVYEAERADEQFHKRVAIKVIKRGMDSELILRRFRQERQILAALEHPNIAGLVDGGATADGLPYLVMEYVDGQPIQKYVATHKLSVKERLKLFRDVCAAVHFAHRNLVVHRDIKPSNILVSADGTVKLLDFGVAKLLRSDLALTVPVTEMGNRMLTPAYASPEQVRGETVTTSSDVYSLGVVLYEILAGKRPYELEERSLEEVEQLVCNDPPATPSSVAAIATTPTSRQKALSLGRILAGELDNIVLMAMRKEPARRYASAAALSDDLGRYLDGLPVLAQKDTAGYRIRKFVARHRTAVAGVAAVVVTLALGISATLWQARETSRARAVAEENLNDVYSLARALVFDIHDAIQDIPGATNARELVVNRAFEYLDRLALQENLDPALRRDVAEAYIRLALIRGMPSGANTGDLENARAALLRAADIASSLTSSNPNDVGAMRTHAIALEKLGDVEAYVGNVAGGVEHAQAALALFSELARRQPSDERALLSLAISSVKLADLQGSPVLPSLGNLDLARSIYDSALRILESEPLVGSSDQGVVRYVALIHERLGSVARARSDWNEALRSFTRSLETRQKLAATPGSGLNAKRDLAVTLQNVCEVQNSLGDQLAAGESCARALDHFEALFRGDPRNVQGSDDLARIHASLASLARSKGDFRSSVAAHKRTVEVRESILADHPENIVNRRLLVYALTDLVHRYVQLAGDTAAIGTEERLASAALRRAEVVERGLVEMGAETGDERGLIASAASSLAKLERGSIP